MKIAYCATVQPKFGGLRTFNLGLSLALKKELVAQGHELILITQEQFKSDYAHCSDNLVLFSGNHFWYENVVLPRKLAELGVDYAIFPHNRIPLLNNDRYKKVCIFHDLLFYRYPEKFSSLKRASRAFFLKTAAEKADFSFSVSEFTAAELQEFVPGHPSTVCWQAINPMRDSQPGSGPVPERFNITKPYFLFFGAQSFQKNLVALIKAFDVMKAEGYDFQLVIAGGKGTAEAEVLQSFEEAAHKQDILFPGFVSEEEKLQLLRHAKAFVFPSVYEGFGIPLLEAFQAGTAVICSNQSCLPEISGGAALEVNPDPAGIAAGMKQLADDEALRQQLISKGKSREKQFSWQKSAAIILEGIGVQQTRQTQPGRIYKEESFTLN